MEKLLALSNDDNVMVRREAIFAICGVLNISDNSFVKVQRILLARGKTHNFILIGSTETRQLNSSENCLQPEVKRHATQ
jgi:hypothetical protein